MDGVNTASPLLTRRAFGKPSTFDREAGTVEAVLSTGADVPRTGSRPDGSFGPWIERLDLGGVTARDGTPVLADHENKTSALVGSVASVRRIGNELRGVIQFASTARAQEIAQLVADGALTGVSTGFTVEQWQRTGERDGVPIFTAAKWTIREVSFVPIPADGAARVRSAGTINSAQEEGGMPDTMTPNPPEMNNAFTQERARVADLTRAASTARSVIGNEATDALHTRAVAEGWDASRLKAAALDEAIRRGATMRAPIAPALVNPYGGGGEHPQMQLQRRADAIASRALGKTPPESAREYMPARLADHARELLTAAGERIDRYASDNAIIARALSTSDFAGLLGSAFEKSLAMLMAADSPVRTICRPRQVEDFRQIEALTFSGPGSLGLMAEGGEVTHAPPAERREVGRVRTFARQVVLTREAIVNDDLGAFADPARLFASAVAETEGAAFAGMFAANGGGFGPTMSNTEPLFIAANGNVGSGTLNTSGVSAARVLMRAQQLPGGGLARVTPRHILVSPQNETAAEQVLTEITIATAENARPVFSGRLLSHVEPRLSGPAFYVLADPTEAAVFEFVTLRGTNGMPQIESFNPGPDRLGVSFRCVHDFAVIPVSWVGAVRMTGT